MNRTINFGKRNIGKIGNQIQRNITTKTTKIIEKPVEELNRNNFKQLLKKMNERKNNVLTKKYPDIKQNNLQYRLLNRLKINLNKPINIIMKDLKTEIKLLSNKLYNNFNKAITYNSINIRFFSFLIDIAKNIKNTSLLKSYLNSLNIYIIKSILYSKNAFNLLNINISNIFSVFENVGLKINKNLFNKINYNFLYSNDLIFLYNTIIFISLTIFIGLKITNNTEYNEIKEIEKYIKSEINFEETAEINFEEKIIKSSKKTLINIFNDKILLLIEYIKTNFNFLTEYELIKYIITNFNYNSKLLNDKILILINYIKTNYKILKIDELIDYIKNKYIIDIELLQNYYYNFSKYINEYYNSLNNKNNILIDTINENKNNEKELITKLFETIEERKLNYELLTKINKENKTYINSKDKDFIFSLSNFLKKNKSITSISSDNIKLFKNELNKLPNPKEYHYEFNNNDLFNIQRNMILQTFATLNNI